MKINLLLLLLLSYIVLSAYYFDGADAFKKKKLFKALLLASALKPKKIILPLPLPLPLPVQIFFECLLWSQFVDFKFSNFKSKISNFQILNFKLQIKNFFISLKLPLPIFKEKTVAIPEPYPVTKYIPYPEPIQ